MERLHIPEFGFVRIPQSEAELPQRASVTNLYLDLETTSKKDKVASTNPWKDCSLLGISILFDDEIEPYYIPVDHRGPNLLKNLDKNEVKKWLIGILSVTDTWINHNIKYDLHVLFHDLGIDALVYIQSVKDTLSLAKLSENAERYTYNLTDLAKDWLYLDIYPFEMEIKKWLGKGYKDYGLIPIEPMAIYAGVDTIITRKLYYLTKGQSTDEASYIRDVEMELVKQVTIMERRGLKTDAKTLIKDYIAIPKRLDEIKAQTWGLEPHNTHDCFELFCNRLGLPVLGRTEDGNPSFGYEQILAYKKYVPEITELVLEYKDAYKLFTSFITSYLSLQDEAGIIRPSYNLIVRTGRMSCSDPNIQQAPERAKVYVVPREGYTFVNIDLSQIEFRVIAHYINNEALVKAYNENPATDYHTWVAQMVGIDRKPAKNINFMLGYGGGKGKCVSMLKELPEIVAELKSEEEMEAKANFIYETYHNTLPELKNTQWNASSTLRQRGYVKTLFGRCRRLPIKAHFKAFNSACQGTAADIMKIRTLEILKRLKDFSDCHLLALIHDCWLFEVPIGKEGDFIVEMKKVIEAPFANFRVPIKCDAKANPVNWKMSCYVPVHKVNKDVYVSLFNPEVKITLGKSISNSDTSVYLDRNIIPADKNAIILEGEYEGIPRKLPLNMYVVNKVKLIKEC